MDEERRLNTEIRLDTLEGRMARLDADLQRLDGDFYRIDGDLEKFREQFDVHTTDEQAGRAMIMHKLDTVSLLLRVAMAMMIGVGVMLVFIAHQVKA